jgi:hypothetical protein
MVPSPRTVSSGIRRIKGTRVNSVRPPFFAPGLGGRTGTLYLFLESIAAERPSAIGGASDFRQLLGGEVCTDPTYSYSPLLNHNWPVFALETVFIL